MNKKLIFKILGIILGIEGVSLLIPFVIALVCRENTAVFGVTALLCLAVGLPLSRLHTAKSRLQNRDGYVAVALGWIVLSAFGALPYALSGCCGYVDALFETVSSRSGTPETTCPTDGVVTEVLKKPGETASEGELLFYLAPEDGFILTCSLSETEAATISAGDPAQVVFAFDADELPYEAAVLSVSSSATQADDGPRYEVRLRLLTRPAALRLGMTATVYFP